MKTSIKPKCISLLLALTLTTGLFFAQAQPAQAQYWPYRYLYLGQALLYPLTRGLTGTLLYGPYNANPLYSASYFTRRAAGMAMQYPYIYGYNPTAYAPMGYRNAGLPPNQNYNYGLNNGDLAGSDGDDASLYNPPVQSKAQPIHMPAQAYQQPYYPAPQAVAPAPPINSSAPFSSSVPPVAVPAVPAVSAASPLAQGFIDHLNSKYEGDLSKALANSDTRSWARAMGVIDESVGDGSYLPADRLETVSRILKDNNLDAVSKLDTMRILLRKSK